MEYSREVKTKMFDVVMPVTQEHNHIAFLSIRSLVRHISPRRIYVMTPESNFPFFKNLPGNCPVSLIDEDTLIPEITFSSIADFIEEAGEKRSRAGWYFQQFLKMSACFLPDITDYYLIWDADTIMLNPIRFLNDSGQTLIKPATEHNQPYFDTYHKLTGFHRSVNFSFINEHFFIKTEYMKELIAAIETNSAPEMTWVWAIMKAVEPRHLSGAGFSEYETYGNFVNTVHPGAFAVRPLATIRYGARKFGLSPNQYDLYRLSLSYAYASFESWDTGKPLRIKAEKLLSFLVYCLRPERFRRG